MKRLLVIGDVGVVRDYHAGDEAMLESLLAELRARLDVDVTVISAAPDESAARYTSQSVPRIGFDEARTPGRAAREARLEQVLHLAQGHENSLDGDDTARLVIDAVAKSDAVVIAGGGNLTTPFAEHVYERAALAQLARLFDKTLVVTGQSFGPELQPRDEELLASILSGAVLVGVREGRSAEVARSLVPDAALVVETLDDATFLEPAEEPLVLPEGLTGGSYVAASFPPAAGLSDLDDYLVEVASLLDRASLLSELPVLLLPHQASFGEGETGPDDVVNKRLAELMSARVVIAPQYSARALVQATRGAALSISGRYHPVVFALSAGVPAIGISVDGYTRQKIRGALDNVGLGDWALRSVALAMGDAALVLEETWARRAEIANHLKTWLPSAVASSTSWWDAVAAVIEGRSPAVPALPTPPPLRLADTSLCRRLERMGEALDASESTLFALRRDLEQAREAHTAEQQSAMTFRSLVDESLSEIERLKRRIVAFSQAGVTFANRETAAQVSVETERDALLLERDALEQQLFERERFSAFLGRQVHELRALLHTTVSNLPPDRSAEAEGAHAAVKLMKDRIAELELQVDGLLGSTSWRASVPIRVAKNPRPYFRKFRGR